MKDEVAMVPLEQGRDVAVRQFLLAQLEWERYRASRLRLVHLLALGGLCLWLLVASGDRLAGSLQLAVLGAWSVCFIAAGLAAMMERHWQRRRQDCIAALDAKARGDS